MSDSQIKALEKLINEKFKHLNYRLGENTKATKRIEKKLDTNIDDVNNLKLESKLNKELQEKMEKNDNKSAKPFVLNFEKLSPQKIIIGLSMIGFGIWTLSQYLLEFINR